MDIEHFQSRLLEKEQQLLSDIAQLDHEAREPLSEVGDEIDEASAAEIQATSLSESTLERRTLALVRDALRRIHEKRFGVCVDCSRPITPARLEALPWTPYCLEDQEKHDALSE